MNPLKQKLEAWAKDQRDTQSYPGDRYAYYAAMNRMLILLWPVIEAAEIKRQNHYADSRENESGPCYCRSCLALRELEAALNNVD